MRLSSLIKVLKESDPFSAFGRWNQPSRLPFCRHFFRMLSAPHSVYLSRFDEDAGTYTPFTCLPSPFPNVGDAAFRLPFRCFLFFKPKDKDSIHVKAFLPVCVRKLTIALYRDTSCQSEKLPAETMDNHHQFAFVDVENNCLFLVSSDQRNYNPAIGGCLRCQRFSKNLCLKNTGVVRFLSIKASTISKSSFLRIYT